LSSFHCRDVRNPFDSFLSLSRYLNFVLTQTSRSRPTIRQQTTNHPCRNTHFSQCLQHDLPDTPPNRPVKPKNGLKQQLVCCGDSLPRSMACNISILSLALPLPFHSFPHPNYIYIPPSNITLPTQQLVNSILTNKPQPQNSQQPSTESSPPPLRITPPPTAPSETRSSPTSPNTSKNYMPASRHMSPG
jgi:hypothetical protein